MNKSSELLLLLEADTYYVVNLVDKEYWGPFNKSGAENTRAIIVRERLVPLFKSSRKALALSPAELDLSIIVTPSLNNYKNYKRSTINVSKT